MEKDLALIGQLVEEKAEQAIRLNREIWGWAELNFREVKSSAALADALETEGFTVNRGIGGMPTAFCASYGTGGPVIGLLAEYDALSALSQKAGCPTPDPVVPGGPGHGCGHSLLGSAVFSAAVAVKDYIDRTGLSMTIRLYGCPAEEDGGGKVYLAREGAFDDLDAAFTWHPAAVNAVKGIGALAVMGVLYTFKGRPAHAASAPQAGRSALDAAELMNIGCQFLREHMTADCRLHYAFRDVGGTAPNVVQSSASLHYYVRAARVEGMFRLFDRLNKVAAGAAMMTETEMEYKIIDGFSDYVPNRTLSELMDRCLQEVGAPAFDDADRTLAAEFAASVSEDERLSNLQGPCEDYDLSSDCFAGKVLDDAVHPLRFVPGRTSYGSTDVGDVSYCAPTAQCEVASRALGTGAHTWQMTAQTNSPIGEKALITAAKVLALTAVRAAADSDLLARAREEWKRSCPDGYRCPMPAENRPEF